MQNSPLFKLTKADFQKGLVMAILGGIALPVLAMLQTPGFDIFHANWNAVLNLAINGGVAGFATYITKNLFSDESGAFLGKIG